MNNSGGRIVGVGGIFFQSADKERLCRWYREQLGIDNGEHGATFPWRSQTDPSQEFVTVWSVFRSDSEYMKPGASSFMVNYIVEDLDALLSRLTENGVRIDPKHEDYDYGRFAWVYDPDGNKIELWEPPARVP